MIVTNTLVLVWPSADPALGTNQLHVARHRPEKAVGSKMAQLGTGCAGVADEDVAAVELVVAVSFCAAATEQATSSRAHSTVARRRPMVTMAGVSIEFWAVAMHRD
jgi:hypothetical protein